MENGSPEPQLKAFRYEDAIENAPPVIVAPQQSLPDPPSPPRPVRGISSLLPSSPKRTRSSASRQSFTSGVLNFRGGGSDSKRDSVVTPPPVASNRLSYTASLRSGRTGVAREPTLPTITVQHEEPVSDMERNTSPNGKRRAQDRSSYTMQSRSTPSLPQHSRMESFRGIDTAIPSSNLGDFNLADLASDKIGFTHRGSMLFGGKKMNDMTAYEGDVTRQNAYRGYLPPISTSGASTTGTYMGSINEKVQQEPPSPVKTVPRTPTRMTDSPRIYASQPGTPQTPQTPQIPEEPKGLRAGRRKPSVQMLQAALEGGRVLSAEEITFSMKVRSMYEAGDERAADWTTPRGFTAPSSAAGSAIDLSQDGSVTPPRATNGAAAGKAANSYNPYSHHMRASAVRASYYNKEATELAGGIEDWVDVNGQDVDRYGFINPARNNSNNMEPGNRNSLQRVATSLRAESRRPRKDRSLRRIPSVAGSSRSLPQRGSGDWTNTQRGPGSIYSTHSHAPSSRTGSIFRSRDRRTLAEASDMLTLPPGLADIAEHEDAGRTASAQKQREWAREQKWQKMARPLRQATGRGKGGGMRFDFDTSDPKLVSRVWKGVPDRWRATAWHSFLSASARKRPVASPASDEELITQYHKLQEENGADDVQIDVDVPRTVSLHIMFRRRYRGGQRLLFRVLHAISLYFPETGYVQGMASLAATFLCYYEEEMAFVMLVRLWQLRGLEQLFQAGFGGLMAALAAFEKDWLRDGDVAKQLQTLGISSTAYGTRWYLTLFNMSIPFPAQLRVWDAFMLLGDLQYAGAKKGPPPGESGGADLDVLHATSAALVDATREILLDSDFENAMKVLTSFVPIKDEDLLMRVTKAEYTMRKKRGKA